MRPHPAWLAVAMALAGPAHAQEPAPPRLAGIVVSRTDRAAIFEATAGTTTPVSEGEQIGPYLVRSITSDRVEVERDGTAVALSVVGSGRPPAVVDDGGVTFGRVVNRQRPPDD